MVIALIPVILCEAVRSCTDLTELMIPCDRVVMYFSTV